MFSNNVKTSVCLSGFCQSETEREHASQKRTCKSEYVDCITYVQNYFSATDRQENSNVSHFKISMLQCIFLQKAILLIPCVR